jgi:CDGSH-type Zn-finger protein
VSDAPAEIVVFRDGPYLVRGAFELVREETGEPVTTRRTIALCGCGRSRTAPFCDGSHKRKRMRSIGSP